MMLKDDLEDKNAPFGVDLLLPQVGGGARKSNKDYTGGTLPELVDIIIEEKAKLFICAVGVPPVWAVEKLHAAGIIIANMVGSVRNTEKALEAGVDIVIAQGSEGGGHTGEIGTFPLIPQVVDACRGRTGPFGPVLCVAAGGIYDGRGLAAALGLGASGVWVGTRFICSEEASAPESHKKKVLAAGSGDTIRTLVLSGRPLRLIPNSYVAEWESKPEKIKELCDKGIVPLMSDFQNEAGMSKEVRQGGFDAINSLAGQAVGGIHTIEPARKIVEDMVAGAVA